MIAFALKGAGAVLVVAVWIAEEASTVADGWKFATLVAGVLLGYAAVRAEKSRRSGRGG